VVIELELAGERRLDQRGCVDDGVSLAGPAALIGSYTGSGHFSSRTIITPFYMV